MSKKKNYPLLINFHFQICSLGQRKNYLLSDAKLSTLSLELEEVVEVFVIELVVLLAGVNHRQAFVQKRIIALE